MDSDLSDAHYYCAKIYQTKGQMEATINQLQQALTIDDENALYHRYLAECFDQKNDTNHAIDHYEKALQFDPNLLDVVYSGQVTNTNW